MPAPGDALRDYTVAELDSAIAGLGWRGGRIHAGVHRARKALRRVRATLALGGDALGPGAPLVDREVRKLNRGLSTLRDAQALVEMLQRLLAEQRPADVLRVLRRAHRAAMTHRAAAAHAAQAADPEQDARCDLLIALRGALESLPWQRLASSQLQIALASSVDRMLRAQARAVHSGDNGHWHRWRRRARRLSQQRRALKAAGIAPAIDVPKASKRIAEQLGAAQDLSLLREHCGRDSPFIKPDRMQLKSLAEVELAQRRQTITASSPDAADRQVPSSGDN